jgi:hypothetical protein
VTELELLKQRREDLKKIESARTTSIPLRLATQGELRAVNARIKELHIEQANADKRAADTRNAAGQAEHRSNLVRSEMNTAPPRSPKIAAGKKILHTGEYVLVQAKRLKGALNRINNPLPHTVAFVTALDAFILAQKQHASEFNAKIVASRAELHAMDAMRELTSTAATTESPSEWAQTWETGKVSE